MRSVGPKCVVIGLVGIPAKPVIEAGADAAEHIVNPADRDAGRGYSRGAAQACFAGGRSDCGKGDVVQDTIAVVTDARRIEEARTEGMAFLECHRGASRVRIVDDVVVLVGLRVISVVIEVGAEQPVIVANLVIDAGSDEVLGNFL